MVNPMPCLPSPSHHQSYALFTIPSHGWEFIPILGDEFPTMLGQSNLIISPWYPHGNYIYYMCIMSPFQVIKIPMMFHQSDYWNLAIRGDNCSTASWSPCGASTGNPWSLLVVRALGRFLSHQWCTSTGKSEAWWFRVIFLNWNWPPKHAICWVWV